MTVKELIKKLKEYPEDSRVVHGLACLLCEDIEEVKVTTFGKGDAKYENTVIIGGEYSNKSFWWREK